MALLEGHVSDMVLAAHNRFSKIEPMKSAIEAYKERLEQELNQCPKIFDKSIDSVESLSRLYLAMLHTVAKTMLVKIDEYIKGDFPDMEKKLDVYIERITRFTEINYSNLTEENIRQHIKDLDAIAWGFDGNPFGNWSVRDIVGTLNGDNYHQYEEELIDGANIYKF